uniref:(northern house mosquito) hypothetical protein n=1 Tax=Culex pipiens TaxID=7175 RepID=A0A8D8IZN6_CULPI
MIPDTSQKAEHTAPARKHQNVRLLGSTRRVHTDNSVFSGQIDYHRLSFHTDQIRSLPGQSIITDCLFHTKQKFRCFTGQSVITDFPGNQSKTSPKFSSNRCACLHRFPPRKTEKTLFSSSPINTKKSGFLRKDVLGLSSR